MSKQKKKATLQDATVESFANSVEPVKYLPLPGVGVVWVHGINALKLKDCAERAEIGDDSVDMSLFTAHKIQECTRKRDGSHVWQRAQVPKIQALPNWIRAAIMIEIDKLSGLGANSSEEILKNLEAIVSTDSSSDDPTSGACPKDKS